MARDKFITHAMQTHADILIGQSLTWVRGRDKRTGRAFVQFESSRLKKDGQPVVYRAGIDGEGCTCPGYLHRGICAHVVAVATVETRAAARASKPMKSFRDLFPECGQCGNLTEGNSGLCDDCSAQNAYRLDRERQCELVAAGGRR